MSQDIVERLSYMVGNPSAWSDGFDQGASDLIREALTLITALTAERDQWQALATEDVEALQAIGDEFGIYGGENRVSGVRRILTEQREALEAFDEVRSFMFAILGADTWIEAGAIWDQNPEHRKATLSALAQVKP